MQGGRPKLGCGFVSLSLGRGHNPTNNVSLEEKSRLEEELGLSYHRSGGAQGTCHRGSGCGVSNKQIS